MSPLSFGKYCKNRSISFQSASFCWLNRRSAETSLHGKDGCIWQSTNDHCGPKMLVWDLVVITSPFQSKVNANFLTIGLLPLTWFFMRSWFRFAGHLWKPLQQRIHMRKVKPFPMIVEKPERSQHDWKIAILYTVNECRAFHAHATGWN